ncbi:MAG: porin [Pseudomonadota bacterium]
MAHAPAFPSSQRPPRRRAWGCVTLISALALAAPARADDEAGAKPAWSVGGFGSVGAVHSDEPHGDFTSSLLKAHGAGYSGSTRFDVDSRVGVQLDANLDKRWSAVLQVISEQGVDGSYQPAVEWFNVKYQITPDLSVRLGRIALPMFLAADYRKAAYAYTLVRPPVEVYGAIPISSSDGIDASYRWNSGDIKHVTQAFYGHNDVKIGANSRAKARGLGGISHTVEYGALTARASFLSTNLTVDLARPLFDAYRQFGPPGAALADTFDVDHKRAQGLSLGAAYDPGQWFVTGEAGILNADSYLGNKSTGYVSAGYRFGNLTPYFAYAQAKSRSAMSDAGLPLAGLPPPVAAAAGYLNGQLNVLLGTVAVQNTSTVGLRWDCMRNAALKVQYDRVRPQDGMASMLINIQPGFEKGRTINVLSAVLDFVF